MKTLKLILNQTVDLILAMVVLGLLIYHLSTGDDVSEMLWIMFGYIVNVIIGKVRIARKSNNQTPYKL